MLIFDVVKVFHFLQVTEFAMSIYLGWPIPSNLKGIGVSYLRDAVLLTWNIL